MSPLPHPNRRACLALLATGAAGLARPAHALPAPAGPVVLSISGRIDHLNVARRADLDMAMLEALPQHGFRTHAPWFDQPHEFSGPLLRDVLGLVGARGERLQAVALNNYRVDVPVDDARRFKLLLATRQDGRPMPVREKGPLFIIYPFDESEELRNQRYYTRSAWQLRSLEVR